jgi:hypothetical protein
MSYAEPGKAKLDDYLRLLTTNESLDTQSLASMRAINGIDKGAPGVHSLDSKGVTRLYVRLKCRSSGELKCQLSTCRRPIIDPDMEPLVTPSWYRPNPMEKSVFDTIGYEMYEASQSIANGRSEIAQIALCMEPLSEALEMERSLKLEG